MKKTSRASIVSLIPFGLGKTKPNHYRDMARVVWENRDNLRYAWRIITHGVCDGCSLGPYGLRDDTIKGVHLCLSRLRLLRINTMPALSAVPEISELRKLNGEQLRNLGRLPYPLIRHKGDSTFTRISWEEALQVAGKYLTNIDPYRFAIYTTSRGLTNEVYYVAGKLARLMGTNNIDNAARLCHAASTTALKNTLGIAASSCSNSDWIGSELIVLAGANIANNQPVAMKYLYRAKEKGTRIVVVNPYREPGLENYWVPSVTKSALFGTKLMDDFFRIAVGGDVAFYNGVMKVLIERNWINQSFIRDHTNSFDALKEELLKQSWELLERQSGTTRGEMNRFAEIYAGVNTAVFIWSMGLTQHRFGVENVKALVNIALARGMIGRPNVGVVPIRGHSGVQGAAEVGSVPGDYFMGLPVGKSEAEKLSGLWNTTEIPSWKGLSAAAMIDAAHEGKLDAFYIIGGNFLETMPDVIYVREALERVPVRIHQDLYFNSSMLAEPGESVLVLPGQTRYEQAGGGTITNTERRVRYSPEIQGPRIGESRSEWQIMVDLAQQILAENKKQHLAFKNAQEIREEIGRVIPAYNGIQDLQKEGDSFQYGGPMLLRDGICNTPDARANFSVVQPSNEVLKEGEFYLATRRGKQFNSIVYGVDDPLVGSKRRDEIFLSAEDASKLGLQKGSPITLESETGTFTGVCKISKVHPGTIQMFWPEANVLISRRIDPMSQEPDYNTIVRIKS
jgi:molybdopterin-dependent oxidoreductase alpha subunit